MSNETRRYHRIEQKTPVRFYEESVDNPVPMPLKGVMTNFSDKGIFISAEHTLPKGSVVTVQFDDVFETCSPHTIRVRGVVRWIRRTPGKRGIGIEIFDFDNLEDRRFIDCISELFQAKE